MLKPVHRNAIPLGLFAFALFGLGGCEKKNGEAIVLSKEHIAAAMVEPPGAKQTASPNEKTNSEEKPRPIRDDEIAVDQYVMTPDVRGTGRDPRALKEEQWLIKVRTMTAGRTFNVSSDRSHFDKLREGERVEVTYRVGKYTGTVWAAEFK